MCVLRTAETTIEMWEGFFVLIIEGARGPGEMEEGVLARRVRPESESRPRPRAENACGVASTGKERAVL